MGINKSCCNQAQDKHNCHPIPKDPKFKPCDCHKPVQKPKPQPCFNMDKLPDIENIEQLAHELCKVNQGFDKCPQYYTKQNYDDLVNTLNGAFFHLYCKVTSIAGCPWFQGLAYNGTDPIQEALQDKRDLPGYYIASEPGVYEYFLYADGDNTGESIQVLEEELLSGIVFLKPKIIYSDTFVGYEKLVVEISAIKNINTSIEEIQEAIQNIDPNIKLQEDIEYNALLELITNKQLEKGQEYKIIDYTFTTTQENTDSAHHDFDIIVVADSEDTLNENARACKKEGDEYFVNNNLAAWELKYSIYNNKTLYTWADEENGKGVIYWLKDEFNNEAGYDFKSALFLESLQVEEISEELYSVYDITSKILDSPALTFSSENDIDLSLTSATFNKIKFRNIIPINIINGSNNNIAGGKNILKNSSNCTIKGSQSLIIDSSDIEVYGSITYILNSSSVKTGQGSYMNSIINSKNITLGNDCQYNTLDYIQYAVYGDDCTSNRLSRCKYLTLKGRCIGLKSDRTSFEYLTIGYDNTYCTLYGNHYSQSYKTFNDNALDGHDQFLLEQDKSDIPETFMKKTNLLTFID